jgi:hypothetical protein
MSENIERLRFSVDLPKYWQDYLAQQAKLYKITQGDVVELLLANMHKSVGIEQAFMARREEKVAARQAARLKSAFERMTPEQQKATLQALNSQAAS